MPAAARSPEISKRGENVRQAYHSSFDLHPPPPPPPPFSSSSRYLFSPFHPLYRVLARTKKKRKEKKKRKGKKEAEITRGRNIVVNTFGRIPGEGSGWFFFFSPSLFSLFSRRGNDVISSLAIIRLGQLHYRAGRGVYAASSRDTSGIITGSG